MATGPGRGQSQEESTKVCTESNNPTNKRHNNRAHRDALVECGVDIGDSGVAGRWHLVGLADVPEVIWTG